MIRSQKPEGRIFISYRRADARGVAGRLSDSLGAYFGHDRVFRDVEDIRGGQDFGHVIEDSLTAADAVIVIIGPDWVSLSGASGERRLDDPDDWVAAEVGSALERGVPVFPVLIEDTPMPQAVELPDRLKPLGRRNAITISDHSWKDDTTRLAKIIAFDLPGSVAERRLSFLRAAIVSMLIAAVVFTTATLAFNAHKLLVDHQASAQQESIENPNRLLAAGATAVN